MYDSGSRVAMMLSGPGVAPGQVINDLTSLNDVFPTCADAAALLIGSGLCIGSSSFCLSVLLLPDPSDAFEPRSVVARTKNARRSPTVV